ncbi:MAG: LysM peptidoglycan-binding domain-containing protein [Trueperaceae bacterium]
MWPFGKSTEKRVQDAIKHDATLGKYKLSVNVAKKVAIVTGEVPEQGMIETIKSVTQGINGIKSVDVSGVKVNAAAATQPAPKADAKSSDTNDTKSDAKAAPTADPSARAKAAYQKIRAEASLANNPLDVLQKGTTIVLRGAVDSEAEHAKAKELASSVEGVTAVDVSGLQVIQHASTLNDTDDDGDVVYTVKAGDTLSHIALHYYGDAGKTSYMKIAEANGIADANKIQVGQKLKIPGTTKGPDVVS